MNFLRKQYLDSLIAKMNNGRVKIITGLRRCRKSYLLFELFAGYLRDSGIQEDQIISLALDEIANAKYRDPFELDKYIRAQIRDSAKSISFCSMRFSSFQMSGTHGAAMTRQNYVC